MKQNQNAECCLQTFRDVDNVAAGNNCVSVKDKKSINVATQLVIKISGRRINE